MNSWLKIYFLLLLPGFLTFPAIATTYYVNVNGTNPTAPYTSWGTAATNIQNAVDAASPGDTVLVTNGIYGGTGRIVSGTTSNTIVVTNSITVESVNGPSVTFIQAYPAPWTTNGSQRCVYLGTGSTISGFTMMNGSVTNEYGGGIDCDFGSDMISNCIITGSLASGGGGGFSGSYQNCIISNNIATTGSGGGVFLSYNSAMNNCSIISNSCNGSGGGVYLNGPTVSVSNCVIACNLASDGGGGSGCSYYNCVISNNYATYGGGIALEDEMPAPILNNCIIVNNYGSEDGGGVYSAGLEANNCLIANNLAQQGAGVYIYGGNAVLNNCTIVENNNIDSSGGIYSVSEAYLTNCIVYFNFERNQPIESDIAGTVTVYACCTTPTAGLGTNYITTSPAFVNVDDGNFNLAAWSPCIDAGDNAAVPGTTDLAGNQRIVNGTVDIGAYEYQYLFTNNVHFVALKGTNATPPFATWQSAATNIQQAIDISSPGDFVVISNGTYNTGGRVIYGVATNRVAVDLPITVQALSGTAVTSIQGSSPGMRCVYLTNGATLIGFTLTGGYEETGDPTNQYGGGIWCESQAATIEGCTLTGNYAANGGGDYSGTLTGCILSNNLATADGGGTYAGTLIGSILRNDTAQSGGGAYLATLLNCAVKNNAASYGAGACFGVMSNCLLLNNGETVGIGGGSCSNILYNCMLVSNVSFSGGGAYSCILSNCTLSDNLSSRNGGGAYASTLANCILSGNRATNSGGGAYACTLTNCLISGSWATNGGGATAGLLVDCTITNNSALNGGGILSNTVFNCLVANNRATNNGGGAYGGTLFNSTIADNFAGAFGGGVIYGTLNGCVVTNNNSAIDGGGVCSNTANNCTVAYNQANVYGGGAYGGTLNSCVIYSNTIFTQNGVGGGGSALANLNSCFIFNNSVHVLTPPYAGGGVFGGTVTSCIISNNSSIEYGGGAAYATLTNCLIISNSIPNMLQAYGGGAYFCSLNNCTVAGNIGGVGGLYASGATNCIVYYNGGTQSINYQGGILENCCTYPLPSSGFGNFTNAPLFVNTNGDFHLQSNSPCINSGNNAYVAEATDLDGNPRIEGGTVDMGAYEYQTPASVISYAYLQRYGLPTDGSADYADIDGTGFDVYQDWVAGLNPTNPASVLAMLPPSPTNNSLGITVTWQSVTNVLYDLQRSTNLPAFTTMRSGIIGHAGTTSYADPTATNSTPYFYRVGVP